MTYWEVTSPYGPLAFAEWSCHGVTGSDALTARACTAGSGRQYPGPGGISHEDIRAQAAAHTRETGHRTEVCQGTAEDLIGLATSP